MTDLLQSIEFWIAVLSGGATVKLVDYLLPALLNRKSNNLNLMANEKHDLREDIDYLRGEIEELREEVRELKEQLHRQEHVASDWQRKYWKKKIELDKVVWQVRNFGDGDVRQRVSHTLADPETSTGSEPE